MKNKMFYYQRNAQNPLRPISLWSGVMRIQDQAGSQSDKNRQIRPTQPKRAAKLTAEAIELLSGIRGLVIGSRDAVLDFYSEK